MSAAEKPVKRAAAARLQHVVAHRMSLGVAAAGGGGGGVDNHSPGPRSGGGGSGGAVGGTTVVMPEHCFDEILVFGQKVDALEHIYQASGRWVYAAVSHGQSFVEALKAVSC